MLAAKPVGVHKLAIYNAGQSDPGVVDKDFATRHPGAEVMSDGAEHDQGASGHVLGAMLPHALDHGRGAAVADREALARLSRAEELAAGCAIEDGVAQQVWLARIIGRRPHDDSAAPHPLPDVIIRLADQDELDPVGEKCPEALARRTGKGEGSRPGWR